MKKHITTLTLLLLTCFGFGPLSAQYSAHYCEQAECPDLCSVEPACPPRGKVDIGAAYVHIDVLLSGHTVHKMDVAAVKGDLNYRLWSGFIIKPTFLFGGGRNDNEVATGGVGLGFCVPLHKTFSLTPIVGYSWGYLRTTFKYPHDMVKALDIGNLRVRERFRSEAPYVALEASWTFRPSWRAVVCYQYSWSRTHTHLRIAGIDPSKIPLPNNPLTAKDTNSNSRSEGSSISGMIEHDLSDSWSVNLGAAYNNSLSKEKHGLRGWGVKFGIAYWF